MATFLDPRVRSLVILAASIDPNLEDTKWYQIPAEWPIISWMLPKDLVVCNCEIRALKLEFEILAKQWSHMQSRITVIQFYENELVESVLINELFSIKK
ncbi:hypothetical protein [Fluviispira vulneris]|uniref:hypothetical protein n=1 Tax=Fluviispira vulneris TaxID=2763012 RepID=UPI001647E728|nr:hypothetical protein [Fluviispira vulneris]